MGICMDGLSAKMKSTRVEVIVAPNESFIVLANIIDWQYLADLVLPDLKKTKRGFWWIGRTLILRIHLGVMILQMLLKETDRGIEKRIMQTPLFQVFCGYGILTRWKCPDHTRIENFRNRLSSEIYRQLCCYIGQIAVKLGLVDPSWMDVDSTVQEANIAYPSDASLMRKLAQKCVKVWEYLKTKGKKYLPKDFYIDFKAINKKAKEYFFLSKNSSIHNKRKIFKDLHRLVKHELQPMIAICENITKNALLNLPWNIRYTINQISSYGWRYLLDVAHFIRTHKIKCGKILSFHCFAAACINKGKVGKDKEFGRVFQTAKLSRGAKRRRDQENRWKFSYSLYVNKYKDARQKKLNSGCNGTSRNFWHRCFRKRGYRQGVFFKKEYFKTSSSWYQLRRHSSPWQCKDANLGGTDPPPKRSPCRNRAPYWSCKEIRTWKKQNEIGSSHFVLWVSLAHRIQFESIKKVSGTGFKKSRLSVRDPHGKSSRISLGIAAVAIMSCY